MGRAHSRQLKYLEGIFNIKPILYTFIIDEAQIALYSEAYCTEKGTTLLQTLAN